MSFDPDDNQPSKSELKRQASRAQETGRRLVDLNPEQLDRLELAPRLRAAIDEYHRVSGFSAQKRQLQYIGKLVREEDQESIEILLADLDGQSAAARHLFHQIERWRTQLIDEPDAMTHFIDQHPAVDRQQLRQLVKAARQNAGDSQQKTAARVLFRFLRDFLVLSGDSDFQR